MPIWRVSSNGPTKLPETKLKEEKLLEEHLEDWIVGGPNDSRGAPSRDWAAGAHP